jgi:hypothetical protein
MSIIYTTNIPPDGNPEGLVDAPQGALFYKNNNFYKLNTSGSVCNAWESVQFQPSSVSSYYLTQTDTQLLSYYTGSYLYVKNTIAGTPYGWTLLSNAPLFIPAPTPTPTFGLLD